MRSKSPKSRAPGALAASLALLVMGGDAAAQPNAFISYDMRMDRADTGFPRVIGADMWPGNWASDIDAAVNWGDGKAYFFAGSQYIRFDIARGEADPGYPKPINDRTWPGLWPDGVDAAINWGDGKVYFFRDGHYIRYDIARDRADPGYPYPVSDEYWPGLSQLGRIDSAVNWGNGKAYFFNGSRYVRYDVRAGLPDRGYPKIVNAGTWPGVWRHGFNSVLAWRGGKAYFFGR